MPIQVSTQEESILTAKTARAMSSGPGQITKDATVAEMGSDGSRVILRQGTNDWFCFPGDENRIGDVPMCADPMGLQWMMDIKARKPKPTNTATLERFHMTDASNITAPTQFIETRLETYAYRRFGNGPGVPLVCLQHFIGTLDNWDPAVTDPLAAGRDVILFDNAGIGRSTGRVPDTVQDMASHALAFLDGLAVTTCDVLGFSLGGMIAQQIALERPSMFRRMILVGTAPRGGQDIMHLEKPVLAGPLRDPALQGYARLQKIFFAPTGSSQAAGLAFVARLAQRADDLDPPSGPQVASAQIAAFREWERFSGERFADLHTIRQPTLVVNGVHDEMIPVANSYALGEHLPNAVLLTYPDSGHGSLFQFHESFTRQAAAFLASDSAFAPY